MKNLITLGSILLLTATACGQQSNSSDKAAQAPTADVTVNSGAPAAVAPNAGTGVTPAETNAPEGGLTSVEAPLVPVALEVDATNKTAYAHLDLDSGKIVLDTDTSWDLAFKRTTIKLNADVSVQVVTDSTFDAIIKAPTANYLQDAPVAGGKETDGLVFHSGLGWYTYNMETHVIDSNDSVYFVKTNAGKEFKVSVNDYYNVDRLPAFIQVKFVEVRTEAAKDTKAE